MILSESLVLIGAGLLLGVPIALAVTRLVTARLFAVRPADPLTIGAAVTLMIAVGALAAFLPAMRSSRVDPIQVLRHE
jgi:ABC-type antimicrobial peptide transport system permease subunit